VVKTNGSNLCQISPRSKRRSLSFPPRRNQNRHETRIQKSLKWLGGITTFWISPKTRVRSRPNPTRLWAKAYKSSTSLTLLSQWGPPSKILCHTNSPKLRMLASYSMTTTPIVFRYSGSRSVTKCSPNCKTKKTTRYSEFCCLISTCLCRSWRETTGSTRLNC